MLLPHRSLQGVPLVGTGLDQKLHLLAGFDLAFPPVEGPLRLQCDAGGETLLEQRPGEGFGLLLVGLRREGQDQRFTHAVPAVPQPGAGLPPGGGPARQRPLAV